MIDFIDTSQFSRKLNNQGYYEINVEGIWYKEHRWVIEQVIGRSLKKEETVHHINFCKTDNRVKNLFPFHSQKEHKRFENNFIRTSWTNPLIRQFNERFDNF